MQRNIPNTSPANNIPANMTRNNDPNFKFYMNQPGNMRPDVTKNPSVIPSKKQRLRKTVDPKLDYKMIPIKGTNPSIKRMYVQRKNYFMDENLIKLPKARGYVRYPIFKNQEPVLGDTPWETSYHDGKFTYATSDKKVVVIDHEAEKSEMIAQVCPADIPVTNLHLSKKPVGDEIRVALEDMALKKTLEYQNQYGEYLPLLLIGGIVVIMLIANK